MTPWPVTISLYIVFNNRLFSTLNFKMRQIFRHAVRQHMCKNSFQKIVKIIGLIVPFYYLYWNGIMI